DGAGAGAAGAGASVAPAGLDIAPCADPVGAGPGIDGEATCPGRGLSADGGVADPGAEAGGPDAPWADRLEPGSPPDRGSDVGRGSPFRCARARACRAADTDWIPGGTAFAAASPPVAAPPVAAPPVAAPPVAAPAGPAAAEPLDGAPEPDAPASCGLSVPRGAAPDDDEPD